VKFGEVLWGPCGKIDKGCKTDFTQLPIDELLILNCALSADLSLTFSVLRTFKTDEIRAGTSMLLKYEGDAELCSSNVIQLLKVGLL
jgi:hypothetical protein